MIEKMKIDDSGSNIEFEGEATLGAEYSENAEKIIQESKENSVHETTDIYPDAIVNIVPESASVFQLKRKYDKKPSLLKLDPDFQRGEVWNQKQKSELIESILMGIPLPVIYVKENDKGVYIIVDGRQRLTTLFQFMNHDFELKNLNVLKNLNGSYFSEKSDTGFKFDKYLSQHDQSRIEDCQLTLHVIKPPTKDRVTFDLFDRVNRGGTRLNNQEMRNAIYQGSATKLLNELVTLDSFKKATENSIKSDRMKDKYLVLRLIAFYLWRKKKLLSVKEEGKPVIEYRSDLEDFLGKTMQFLNDDAGKEFCNEFKQLFDRTMIECTFILGEGCFRLPKNNNGIRRPINMALFETASYLIIDTLELLPSRASRIKDAFLKLLQSSNFIRSLTYTVDSNISVYTRFELVENEIKGIM